MAAKTTEVWFITFQFNTGSGVTICGTEHACKTAYDEWTDYKHGEFKEENKLIEVEGHEDSPCQEYRKVGVDAECIIEATVGKY
jgi:hypothetical protein